MYKSFKEVMSELRFVILCKFASWITLNVR